MLKEASKSSKRSRHASGVPRMACMPHVVSITNRLLTRAEAGIVSQIMTEYTSPAFASTSCRGRLDRPGPCWTMPLSQQPKRWGDVSLLPRSSFMPCWNLGIFSKLTYVISIRARTTAFQGQLL